VIFGVTFESLATTYAVSFALSVARVAGFVVVSPLPGEHAPMHARVALVLVLGVLVTPIALVSNGLTLGLGLAVPAMLELGLGLLIGIAFRFVLAAADSLGGLLSQAVGLGMPSIFNPSLGAQDTAFGQVMGLFALLLALALGVHRVALSYLLASFRALPVGGALRLDRSLPVMIELGGAAIAVGARLAMPVVVAAVAIQLVLALLARAAPSMQLFAIGFTVLLVAGFAISIASIPSIGRGLAEHFTVLGGAIDRLLVAVSPWG
jgi:flagellar biosynthesis protein FliR